MNEKQTDEVFQVKITKAGLYDNLDQDIIYLHDLKKLKNKNAVKLMLTAMNGIGDCLMNFEDSKQKEQLFFVCAAKVVKSLKEKNPGLTLDQLIEYAELEKHYILK